jgi:hypothetical protein
MRKCIHGDYEIANDFAVFRIASAIITKISVTILKGSTLGSILFSIYDNDTHFVYKLDTGLQTGYWFTNLC